MDNHRQYSKISKAERRSIIQAVLEEKRMIADVAKEFNVLPTTCKSIINTYIKEGRIGKKERRIRKVKKVTVLCTIVINPLNPLQSTIQAEYEIQDVQQPSLQSNQVQNEEPQVTTQEFLQQWMNNYKAEYEKSMEKFS